MVASFSPVVVGTVCTELYMLAAIDSTYRDFLLAGDHRFPFWLRIWSGVRSGRHVLHFHGGLPCRRPRLATANAPGAILEGCQKTASDPETVEHSAQAVSSRAPPDVTTTVCSWCAASERSRVRTVQPSFRVTVFGPPIAIIGSIVNTRPSVKTSAKRRS
jgi:hypothetical protein